MKGGRGGEGERGIVRERMSEVSESPETRGNSVIVDGHRETGETGRSVGEVLRQAIVKVISAGIVPH